MEQISSKYKELLRTITKPNSKFYPDPLLHQFTWNRNITCFYICLFYLIFVSIFLLIFNFTLPLNLTFIAINIWVLFSFIALCRSYLLVFNIIYILISLTYGWKGFDYIPEAAYAFSGYIFMITTCILTLSADVKLTVFAGGFHIFLCLTKFKEKLIVVIQEEKPEEFVDIYMKFVIFFFILMLLANIALVKTLDKRSIELLKTKIALESALEQQKTFIFSFSHELRNPINSLLGNLQLVLQGENLSAKAVEMVTTAKVCGEILLHNINNVLDIGKYEIGKLELHLVSTQLGELFQRTWGIYSELLRQKKLKSQLKIDKDLPAVVKIDSHKINQILLNLIGNSIKFTEKGSVTVTVKWLLYQEINEKCFEPVPYDDIDEGIFEKEENLSSMMDTSRISDSKPSFLGFGNERRSISCDQIIPPVLDQQEAKGILKIIVKDTGCGIKEEALEKLFRKFSQVSEHVSQRQIGTGLGLFITREICLAMKGEIRAYSKFGVGSTFIVCLPLSTVPSESRLQRAGSEVIISELSQKHIKALVADDSPFNVNLVCNYFSQFGASVVSVAYNGYDIWMKYKEKMSSGVEIDVVTLDIDMPIMNGRKVCDNIRQYERENRLKPVVIILISGNYDREQVEEYINPEKGNRADCFLRKPVSFSEFSRAVYNLVNHSG